MSVSVQGTLERCAVVDIVRDGVDDGVQWTAVVRQGSLILENVSCVGSTTQWTLDIAGRTALSVCYEPEGEPPICSLPLTVLPKGSKSCLGQNQGFITQAPGEKKTNVGAIVGGVIGGVVFIFFFAMILMYYLRRRRVNNLSSSHSNVGPPPYAFTGRPEVQMEGGSVGKDQWERFRKGSTHSTLSKWTSRGDRDAVEFPLPPNMNPQMSQGQGHQGEFPPIPPVLKVQQSFVIESPEAVVKRNTERT